jgi:hypothetical protein
VFAGISGSTRIMSTSAPPRSGSPSLVIIYRLGTISTQIAFNLRFFAAKPKEIVTIHKIQSSHNLAADLVK